MGRIFCLLGKSAVGKDTMFKQIIRDPSIDIAPIILYTTRPKRSSEVDGIDYHFVSEQVMNSLEREDKIIEKRQYATIHGIWYYFTTKFDIPDGRHFMTITTPGGYRKLAEKIGKEKMVLVHLKADDRTRLERSILRESRQKQPNYAEVCRRYLADEQDFENADFSDFTLFEIDANSEAICCLNQFKGFFEGLGH